MPSQNATEKHMQLENTIGKCHCNIPLQNAIGKCHLKMPLQNA
jgi:hypothetical protein